MTTLSLLLFLILNLGLTASSFLIAANLNKYKFDTYTKLILSTFTIFVSQIILIEIILGTIGTLSYLNISIIGLGSFILSTAILAKPVIKNLKIPKLNFSITLFALIIFAPLAIFLLIKAFNSLFQIPLEYDSVSYHLPFVVEWIKTHSLLNLYYTAFASPIAYYPSNYELLDLWTIIPFKNDFFANLLNFPIFILLGIVIYKIQTNLNIQKNISIIVTTLILYTPLFLRQTGTPLTDLFFSLMFLLSIYFLQEKNLILFGLSLGLFIGTKYLGLIFSVVPIILMICYLAFLKIKKHSASFLKPAIIVSISTFITGGFFYIRNWINSSNPLFPVDIKIFGLQLFEGYKNTNEKLLSTSIVNNLHSFQNLKTIGFEFFKAVGFLEILIFTFAIATIIFTIYKIFSHKSKNDKTDLLTGTILSLSLILYLFFYLNSPYSFVNLTENIRYAMPLLIIGTINIGFIISRIKHTKIIFYLISFFTIISSIFLIIHPLKSISYSNRFNLDFFTITNYKIYFSIFLIIILGIFFAYNLFQFSTKKFIKIPLICLLITTSLLLTLKITTFSYTERENLSEDFYKETFKTDPKAESVMEASFWLNKNAKNAKIAYTGFNFHYHLFGRDLSRDVDYININDCLNCRYVDYKNSENSIRENPDYDNWFENLKSKNKNYLVIETENIEDVKNKEYAWTLSHPNNFKEVFSKNTIHVYEILYD